MLKKIIALLTVMALASLSLPSLAAKGGEKGPAERAYDRASDNASFKRDRDHDDDGKKHKKKDKNKHHEDDDWKKHEEKDKKRHDRDPVDPSDTNLQYHKKKK